MEASWRWKLDVRRLYQDFLGAAKLPDENRISSMLYRV